MIYNVTYTRPGSDKYFECVAIASSENVAEFYFRDKTNWFNIEEGSEYDLAAARKWGTPIVEIGSDVNGYEKEIYSASYLVHKISLKHNANPAWIWDVLNQFYAIHKGDGAYMDRKQAMELDYIIRTGIEGLW